MMASIPGFPVEASKHAQEVDFLFLGLIIASILIVLLLFVLILYCVVRYRKGSDADRTPVHLKSIKMEISWTLATTVAFLGFFVWGVVLYLDTGDDDPGAERIYVLGRQWMWDIRYPNGRRDHNRLTVPLGRPVRLIMTSEDVIHSLFLPAMRMKQDLVPGRYVSLSFIPNRVGTYPLYCAQYCGTKHSHMLGTLVVLEDQAYQKWLSSGDPIPPMAAEGRRLFAEKGCAGCHAPGASVHAPLLDGLFGSRVPLADGDFVEADEQYLHDSILLPLKQVAAGYTPVMPSYQGQLEETEVLELVEYIKTLGPREITLPPVEGSGPTPEMIRKETSAP